MNMHAVFGERYNGGWWWLCFCPSQVLLEGVAVCSSVLLELCSAHCSTGWLQEPSASGRLEMWKDKPQTSGWTSKMSIALSLINYIQQDIGVSLVCFLKIEMSSGDKKFCQSVRKQLGARGSWNLKTAEWLLAFVPGYSQTLNIE